MLVPLEELHGRPVVYVYVYVYVPQPHPAAVAIITVTPDDGGNESQI
ncbi:hypothetical protein [Streptomyces blattellae]|nr:hypothetical protein [Streptomyces blattellae]